MEFKGLSDLGIGDPLRVLYKVTHSKRRSLVDNHLGYCLWRVMQVMFVFYFLPSFLEFRLSHHVESRKGTKGLL